MRPVFCNSNDKDYQQKLNTLLKPIFFDFSFWYDLNLWDENYESYAFEDEGRIVSNLCVYRAKARLRGREGLALSVGAVATLPEYRGRGLSRALFERLFARYPGTPMYLSANDSVLDFYPRLGFSPFAEKLPRAGVALENPPQATLLRHDDPKVRAYVYQRVNYAHSFDLLNTQSITMFHLYSGAYEGKLYELPDLRTLVVASREGGNLHLHGVFSLQPVSFAVLAGQLPFSGIRCLTFGFMPPWPDCPYEMTDSPEPEAWFVRSAPGPLGDLKIPELSIT